MPQYLKYPDIVCPQPRDFEPPGKRILVSKALGHRILLPEDGELVLGRFDPEYETKPDVDLSAENQMAGGISRHHARIVGWRGQYEIEDLESSNGTWMNGERLEPLRKCALDIGDEVRFGNCIFYFDLPPALWKTPVTENQCFIYVTFTGHYYPLPAQNTILIGRSDPHLAFTPDINLDDEEESMTVVSRRHIKMTRYNEQFMVEDMGSTYKTKLNGMQVYAGIKVPIYPGQHLWLGGYTLAFDVIEKPNASTVEQDSH
jgi:pSer/pThr/pTyr-binding forkhead associated (FHA) protein